MPNYTSNKLRIQCNNLEIMDKIKGLIFVKDENGGIQHSMEKLLPMQQGYSDKPGHSKYGHERYWKVWCTKWDVCNSKFEDSGHTLTLFYETLWGTNDVWVMRFCKQINRIVDNLGNAESLIIQVEHDYWELMIGFVGKLIWKPGEKIKYHESGLMEYASLYDRPFHDYLVAKHGYEPFIPKA
jgi:hypothetical protein